MLASVDTPVKSAILLAFFTVASIAMYFIYRRAGASAYWAASLAWLVVGAIGVGGQLLQRVFR